MKLLFLDIDGVLNGHETHTNGYCGIKPYNVEVLNSILGAVPDVQIVISSAWRYMIYPDAMTLKGFEYLLIVSGLNCRGRIHGHTVRDEIIEEREDQILDYARKNNCQEFIVLDDMDLKMTQLVRTNGKVGITNTEAQKVIALLGGINE